MTSMMSMTFMTSMKYMKLAVYLDPYISLNYSSTCCFFLHRKVIITEYFSKDG
jgi:hypothetical protein